MSGRVTSRVVVVGSGSWKNRPILDAWLDRVLDELPRGVDLLVVACGAKGAGAMAVEWASRKSVACRCMLPQREAFGAGAGAACNAEALNLGADLVLAFHEDYRRSRDARDMLERAAARGIRWQRFDESSVRPVEESRP